MKWAGVVILVFTGVAIAVFFVLPPAALSPSVRRIADEGVLYPTPILSPEGAKIAKILAVGDVMLGRYVQTLIEKNGSDYPFTRSSGTIRAYTAVFANLEGPILFDAVKTPINSMSFQFPSSTAKILKDNNITVVTLANNHLLDSGEKGYRSTREFLSSSSVLATGHPTRISPDLVATVETPSGMSTFVGFNATYPTFRISDAVSAVRAAMASSGLLIVAIHWGEEYAKKANVSQRNIGRALIDVGVDVVIGHHPHVVQDMEIYRGKPIFYSLGNFIFDQYFSDEVQEGLGVEMEWNSSAVQYRLLPLKSAKSQPEFLAGKEKSEWLADYAKRCDESIRDIVAEGEFSVKK